MQSFTRADGLSLRIVPGFREWALQYRRAVTPRKGWTAEDYVVAEQEKRGRHRRLIADLGRWGGTIHAVRILDVGCGDCVATLLLGEEPVQEAIGVDIDPLVFAEGEKPARVRRLVARILGLEDAEQITAAMDQLPVRILRQDATTLEFPDGTFDWVFSRWVMEHVNPAEDALAEMVRVTRPGGLIHVAIDPFYWLRGCHKRGVVDIPFAHARLCLDEYTRFVREYEGQQTAEKRCRRLATLNRFSLDRWRELVEAMPGSELLEWKQSPSEVGQRVLKDHPEIVDSLISGVAPDDLVHEQILAWLRKR